MKGSGTPMFVCGKDGSPQMTDHSFINLLVTKVPLILLPNVPDLFRTGIQRCLGTRGGAHYEELLSQQWRDLLGGVPSRVACTGPLRTVSTNHCFIVFTYPRRFDTLVTKKLKHGSSSPESSWTTPSRPPVTDPHPGLR